MPGFLSHYVFGTEVTDRMSENYIQKVIRENNHAFLLGLQGSDLFSFTPQSLSKRGLSYRTAAQSLQNQEYAAFFNHMLDSIEEIDAASKDICIAYMAGYLCYYTMDLFLSPYIFYRVWQDLPPKCSMARMNSHKSEVETIIDTVLLRTHCHLEPSRLNFNALTYAGKHEIKAISQILYRTMQETYKYTISRSELTNGLRQLKRTYVYLQPDEKVKRLWCDVFRRSGPMAAFKQKHVYVDFREDVMDYMNVMNNNWYPYPGSLTGRNDSVEDIYGLARAHCQNLLESFDSCVSWGMDREDFISSIMNMAPYA